MPSLFQRVFDVPNFTQQAYRYGISFSCLGVLLNWLGVAQVYMGPVRYLGIGLVLFGSFLIITSMCRWLLKAISQNSSQNLESELNSVNVNELQPLHIIDVPLDALQATYSINCSPIGKPPPDYYLVAENPPSYDDAMAMRPFTSLEMNIQTPSAVHILPIARAESCNSDMMISNTNLNDRREINLYHLTNCVSLPLISSVTNSNFATHSLCTSMENLNSHS